MGSTQKKYGLQPSQSPHTPSGRSSRKEYHEFNSLKFIGHGGYGHVYSVQKRNGNDKNEVYALKEVAIDQSEIGIEIEKYEEKIRNERKILEIVQGSHFCIQMLYAFKIDQKYYLALEYYPRGDLCRHLQNHQQLGYNTARLCTAEIVLALEFLHSRGIVHRDLKPENILIDKLGHLVLADFGLAVQLAENRTVQGGSGTFEYMAPEAIRTSEEGFSYAVDFWSLGCLLYQMLTGRLPFEVDEDFSDDIHSAQFLTWHILYAEPSYEYQNFRTHNIAKRFLEGMLHKKTQERLGTGPNGINDIKTHQFFSNINWQYVYHKKYTLLGEMPTERNGNEVVIHCQRKIFRKEFIRNGYDFVSKNLSKTGEPETMKSKLEKILGPNQRLFDALYDEQREPKFQLYSEQYDCHLLLPRSKLKAVIKKWTTTNPSNNNNV